jgi:hypothetical protein
VLACVDLLDRLQLILESGGNTNEYAIITINLGEGRRTRRKTSVAWAKTHALKDKFIALYKYQFIP